MNKERYNQIIDEVYEKYQTQTMFNTEDLVSLKELDGMDMSTGEIKKIYRQYAPKEFINKCKTDSEFSEKWGLKIEEQELSWEERLELWYQKNKSETGKRGIWEIDYIEKYEGHKKLNSYNIPTKLITLTYNNETIECYE